MTDIEVRTVRGRHQVTVEGFFQMTVSEGSFAVIELAGDHLEAVRNGRQVMIRVKERYAYMAPEIRAEMAKQIEGEK